MAIAILGTRGIPAAYGGFETFAEELSARLAARGHTVYVYGRPHAVAARVSEHRGARVILLPSIRHKYFETISHTCISALHLLFRGGVDVALFCNAANSAFTWLPRLRGIPVALNVDGLERLRRKWNALGRAWYALGEWLATWMPTSIVTDARSIEAYYRRRYGAASDFIPYGASAPADTGTDVIERLGLEPGRYILYVSRLEPENNALLVVRAFEQVPGDVRLAIVGDAPYAADYIREVRNTADRRIVFPGAVYGAGYSQLRAHALAYVHATEVGGTHPALIEAMAAGLPILYLDTPENREVAGDAGVAFWNSISGLAEKLRALLADDTDAPPETGPGAGAHGRRQLGERARARVRERYDWEAVTTAYEQHFRRLLRKRT